MREQIKLYLCNEEGQRFFGEGPYQLLDCIERCGSLRSAAQEMNMAYTKAYKSACARAASQLYDEYFSGFRETAPADHRTKTDR